MKGLDFMKSISGIDINELNKVLDTLKKAVTETDVTAYQLAREDLQAVVALAVDRRTPLRDKLKRGKGFGRAHSWMKMTSMGTSEANTFFANGGVPTATQLSYKRVSASYACIGDIAQVTLFDQVAGANFQDNKEASVAVKSKNVARGEEWGLIWGDSDYGSGYQFDGLNKSITTNVVDKAGAAITDLTEVNEACQKIYDAGGRPNILVCGSRERRRLSNAIFSTSYRVLQTVKEDAMDITAGVSVGRFVSDFSDQPIDIVCSPYLTPGLRGNLSTYGTNSDMFVLDTESTMEDGNALQMIDLMPISRITLPMSDTSYRELVAEFTVLQITSEIFQAVITDCGA